MELFQCPRCMQHLPREEFQIVDLVGFGGGPNVVDAVGNMPARFGSSRKRTVIGSTRNLVFAPPAVLTPTDDLLRSTSTGTGCGSREQHASEVSYVTGATRSSAMPTMTSNGCLQLFAISAVVTC